MHKIVIRTIKKTCWGGWIQDRIHTHAANPEGTMKTCANRNHGGAGIRELRPFETNPGGRDGSHGSEADRPGEMGVRGPFRESYPGSGMGHRHSDGHHWNMLIFLPY